MAARADQAALVAMARQILEETYGPCTDAIHVSIRSGERDISFTWPAAIIGAVPLSLSTFERDVLAALGTETMPAKRIAGRMGRQPDSGFRLLLGNFVDRVPPIIERTVDGYRRVLEMFPKPS